MEVLVKDEFFNHGAPEGIMTGKVPNQTASLFVTARFSRKIEEQVLSIRHGIILLTDRPAFRPVAVPAVGDYETAKASVMATRIRRFPSKGARPCEDNMLSSSRMSPSCHENESVSSS